MSEIKSKNFRKSRLKNSFISGFKKFSQMAVLVIIGEYMLLNVVYLSISEQNPANLYRRVPTKIINLAVSDKPILGVAQAYDSMKNTMDFDHLISRHYPAHIKGIRPDFRAISLQDKEGAKVGYVVKF